MTDYERENPATYLISRRSYIKNAVVKKITKVTAAKKIKGFTDVKLEDFDDMMMNRLNTKGMNEESKISD